MIKVLDHSSSNTIVGGTVALCYTEGVGVQEMIDSISYFKGKKGDEEAEKRCCGVAGGTRWFNVGTGYCKFSKFLLVRAGTETEQQ